MVRPTIGVIAMSSHSIEDLERIDYYAMLNELGIDDSYVKKDMLNVPVMEFPDSNIFLAPSKIHGVGVFTTYLAPNINILAAVKNKFKTIIGRYTNHSPTPNARIVILGDKTFLVALRVLSNEEITTNYRDSLKEFVNGRSTEIS